MHIQLITHSKGRLHFVCAAINAMKSQTVKNFVHRIHAIDYTDEQLAFIHRIIGGDKRFIVEPKPNLNQKENLVRNFADLPKDTEYCLKIDDDDVYPPDYIEIILNQARRHQADLTSMVSRLDYSVDKNTSQFVAKASFYGMTMCFSRKAINYLLTWPNHDMHAFEDAWADFSLRQAGYKCITVESEKPALLYVMHGANTSTGTPKKPPQRFTYPGLVHNDGVELYLHTVYIPRENIFFLEEWCLYHLMNGVDKIFLYDNSGSLWVDEAMQGNMQLDGTNKYGFDIYGYSSHLDYRQIDVIHKNILSKFCGRVERVVWQPQDADGNITYAQDDALRDFVANHMPKVKNIWCLAMDIDEYLYSVSGESIRDIVLQAVEEQKNGIVLLQQKFKDRFLRHHVDGSLRISPMAIEESMAMNGSTWGSKAAFLGSALKMHEVIDIHHPPLDGKYLFPTAQSIRINHYNHNPNYHEWLLGWVQNDQHRRWLQNGDKDWQPKPWEEVFDRKDNCGRRMYATMPEWEYEIIPLAPKTG